MSTDTFNIFGRTKERTFKCMISSTDTGEWALIHSIPSLIELDIFDGIFLSDNLPKEESEKLLLRKGIYKCDIHTVSYPSNHQLDPEEWDMDISIDNIELIITLP